MIYLIEVQFSKPVINKTIKGSFPVPPFKFTFEKSIYHCHNAMKFGVVNKSTILNRFVLHTLLRNITRLAVITRKTNKKIGILKGGNWKRAQIKRIPSIILTKREFEKNIETEVDY